MQFFYLKSPKKLFKDYNIVYTTYKYLKNYKEMYTVLVCDQLLVNNVLIKEENQQNIKLIKIYNGLVSKIKYEFSLSKYDKEMFFLQTQNVRC